jgi:hypothetical protein
MADKSVNEYDFIQFDDESLKKQAMFKEQVVKLTADIDALISPSARVEALKKLSECYMWIGKAIRDDQIARTGKPKKAG